MKDIQLIALDMDGTLLRSDGEIGPRTLDALRQVQRRGVKLVLCSARPLAGLTPYAEQLHMAQHGGYLTAYGGGEVLQLGTNRRLFWQTMPAGDLHDIYEIARENGLHLLTYRENILYTADDDPYITLENDNNFLTTCRVRDFRAEVGFASPKCLMTGDPEVVANVFEAVAGRCEGRFEVVMSAPFFIEICPLGISKKRALEIVMQAEGLTAAKVAAFGDSPNDLPMFAAAGVAIAMGNAVEVVKERAHLVTASNDNDGIADIVERYWL